ncbi:NADH-quinone oxidoreductase subunit L [Gloeobacter kilaueensis]|uniref:NADH-quinone oxidoreductase subunit L n=1 Tax=Gloeobacter kilaueensis TaxID=1416614 RepID=UPI001651634B|nr:NADH-quinone oxidoreductase subunit L [Gloeobacter kilaueensis]
MQFGWLIPIYCAAGALISLPWALTQWKGQRAVVFTGIALTALALVHSGLMLPAVLAGKGGTFELPWLNLGSVNIEASFLINPLTAGTLALVSFVSLLVQFYSVGYMDSEHRLARYYGLINFFTMAMLGLVLSDNLLVMYGFWELMGLSSYLLVGFWWSKPEATAAAKKAFITTRVGDFLLLVGIILLYTSAGTLDISQLGEWAHTATVAAPLATIIVLLLFAGPVGKSAQFPLHVWLPDAMEGPTPASALIHAATMVAAGVFMVVRLMPVFELSSTAMLVVAYTGAITALGAALIATSQNDIKRVLAYSTISQLGYMFMALGVGNTEAAMFHLFTHAFFKAMLFLGAGSVIHSAHTQDMREMGGLMSRMPITALTYGVGVLALAGVFPFAGFWSKDAILHALEHAGLYPVFVMGLLTAGLTAFYMGRQFILVFLGAPTAKSRSAHESTWTMILPLLALVVPAAAAGYLGNTWFLHEPMDMTLLVSSSLVVAVGLTVAVAVYSLHLAPKGLVEALEPVRTALENRLYIDDLYAQLFGRGLEGIAIVIAWVDRNVVDGIVNLVSAAILLGGEGLKYLETGKAQFYLLVVFAAVIALGVMVGVR